VHSNRRPRSSLRQKEDRSISRRTSTARSSIVVVDSTDDLLFDVFAVVVQEVLPATSGGAATADWYTMSGVAIRTTTSNPIDSYRSTYLRKLRGWHPSQPARTATGRRRLLPLLPPMLLEAQPLVVLVAAAALLLVLPTTLALLAIVFEAVLVTAPTAVDRKDVVIIAVGQQRARLFSCRLVPGRDGQQ